MSDALLILRGAAQAFIDACEMTGFVEILRAGNQPEVTKAIVRRKIGATAGTIRTSLLTRMNVVTCRHYTPTHKGDYNAKKVFKLLEVDALRSEVLALEGKDANKLEEARFIWRTCCNDPRLDAYLHLRHKHIVHLGIFEPKTKEPLTFKDIFELTENTIRCFDVLAQSLGLATTDLKFERELRRADAKLFWSAIAAE
jgi:hypothetical protein